LALKRQSVALHINGLVLEGFSPADRHAIGDSVERELTRLIEEQGLTQMRGIRAPIGYMNAGRVQAVPGGSAQALGAQVARAIYRQLRGPARRR
jgi:hypothetical protein